MDVDAFVAGHRQEWARLEQLSAQRRLNPAEVDELIALYRRTATHLSLVRSRTPDPATTAHLSRLLSRARAAVVGEPQARGWAALRRGVLVDFPVAVYLAWRWWVSVAVANIAVAAAMMLYLQAHPRKLEQVLSDDQIKQLVNHDFADYYRENAAHSFALKVWTNNALVAALALFLGVSIVGTIYVLFQNILNLGVVGGAMLSAGKASIFFGLILPHGLLELTAIFVAAGAGLRVGWAWIAPGRQPRSRALAQAGRSAVTIALGLVVVLAVSGVLEAFVTPSGLPTAARIAIGVLAEVAFLSYVVILGRRGVAAGATGDLPLGEQEDYLPVA
ncbi:uncharacterized membrane protein SpoIIM required for sporulation [Jatrophihabitans sp. GAS493]|uniref:stage II sporulation protein M n=1 Tax=Jatrophihabitans sp. GAS493 TaxID=1907575 RepID=UPI000BB7A3BF|nr:stage II sporulation protein M [Jatrophihabitans sp. GAS493]SOD73094.1 uncharacterized membrane protein SpoIIM required for sporulation [Jatrophihabitans sp. GAS493]